VPITTLGKITLTAVTGGGNDITFTTDPSTYTIFWSKRRSSFPGLNGSVTVQDFGKFAADALIDIKSGSQWINKSVVTDMDENDAIKGATWRLQDYEGNDFTVSIDHWKPEMVAGMAILGLYTYDLLLRVHAIAKLRGVTYTGN